MCSATEEMMLQIGQLVPFPRTSVAFYGTDDDLEFRLICSVMRVTNDVLEAKLPGNAPMRAISCRSIRTLLSRPSRVYRKVVAYVFRGHVDLIHTVLGRTSLDTQFNDKLHCRCVLISDNDDPDDDETIPLISIYAWDILN